MLIPSDMAFTNHSLLPAACHSAYHYASNISFLIPRGNAVLLGIASHTTVRTQ